MERVKPSFTGSPNMPEEKASPLAVVIGKVTMDEAFRLEDEAALPTPKPYTVKSWGQILAASLPPRIAIYGDLFALRQVQVVVGQGGVGKSRWVTGLAVAQVLGREFCGLPTHAKPLRWLFLGTENSLHRQQNDLKAIHSTVNSTENTLLDSHLFFQVVDSLEDAFMSLSETAIQQKWRDTIKEVNPDVVVVDPFGEAMAGDVNKDQDVRATMRTLVRVCRCVNHEAGIVILHHARTGRQNIGQAAGWDKANFALGSKALYSGCRAMINLAPGKADDSGSVVMSCAKANDCRPFETRGLMLDEATMTYVVDPGFDLDAWQADVDGKRAAKSGGMSVMDVVDACQDRVEKKDLVDRLMAEKGVSKPCVYKWILRAKEISAIREGKEGLVSTGRFKPRKSVKDVGTPDVI